jgi:uncharacterized protein (DUF2141 family)
MLALSPLLLGAGEHAGRLEVNLHGLRSDKGIVRLCLTRDARYFPGCKGDPHARHLSAPAGKAASIAFADLPEGHYALSVFHDENANGELDKFAKIPREGFGFSRNPAIRFGPPHFGDVRFAVPAGQVRQDVRFRYIL